MTRAAVYRLFDSGGDLLYIGCSVNPRRRIAHHRARRTWGRRVDPTRTLIVWHSSLTEAAEAEYAAIAAEAPLCNARMQRYGSTEESIRAQRSGGYAMLALRRQNPRCCRYRCNEPGAGKDERGWPVCEDHSTVRKALGL